ncbi:phage major tail tube protein [Cognatishimia sp. MH4019]|uniref:phage major tail tube protein n=1 Tax=Cognatishimia sp. MH4019 TaxID=2854030 RepID=UPI001CD4E6A2|nr:phage major tail tube protein [Cognatishimia sp. MH4019]
MQIQRKFNCFVAGVSQHLIVEGCTPPQVKDVYEEVKAGGLIGAVDVALGLAKMEAGIKVNAREKYLMKQVGMLPGKRLDITLRSVDLSEIDGSQQNEVISFDGRLNAEYAGWEAQSVLKDEYKIGSIFYYKHLIDGEKIHHIDQLNHILIVDGVDLSAELRNGMGL